MRIRGPVLFLILLSLGSLTDIASARSRHDPKLQARGPESLGEASRPVIELQDGLLTVRIRHAPWEAVLKEIEHHTGIKIHVAGPLPGMLTEEFEALPVEQGLRRLFRDANLLFFYATRTTESAPTERLIRVWLLPKEGGARGDKQLRRSSSGIAETKQQEEPGSVTETAEALPSEEGTAPEGEPVAEETIEERLEALDAYAAEGNSEALQQAIFDADLTIQATAFELLADRDGQEAITVLVEATKSDQIEMRLQALQLLHQTDQADNGTVLTILGQALADGDVNVKGYAIQALADRGGSDALRYLRQAFRDPDPFVRIMVLENIVQKDEGLPLLQEALMDDDETVRSTAAAWLKEADRETEGKSRQEGQKGKGAQ